VYCKNGHLCAFDSGLLEKDVNIYISGYLKPIYCDNQSITNAVLAKDIGPISKWLITGFDSCQEAIIVLFTPLGKYYLMQPSDDYKPFMKLIKEQIFLSKIVIECLLDDPYIEYEELLNKFEVLISLVIKLKSKL
jgi:DNA (cytosine-5)-methyltransferase 1